MKNKLQIWSLTLLLLALVSSCTQEELPSEEGRGGLLLTLNDATISTEVEETRALPRDIEHKLTDFDIRITRQSDKWIAYNNKYTGKRISVYSGTYDVEASFGQNENLAYDAPYFYGITDLTIVSDETVQKSIHCSVANSLVSVKFEDKDRFERYFNTYELLVELNGEVLALNEGNQEQSIYFPSGSTPIISFQGTLKADGNRGVKQKIESSEIPTTFRAGVHAIITLKVDENAEEGAMIFVKKVDVEYVDVESVFPVEWLPTPDVTAYHVYEENVLKGTKIDFSNGYPGKNWKVEIYNTTNVLVRQVEGNGPLTSNIDYSEEWPYLPQGNYKARFYVELCGKMIQTREKTFAVAAPVVQLKQGGYTSYTKYLQGDASGANKCDRSTIYAPQVSLLIDDRLITKMKCSIQMTNVDGTPKSTTTSNVLICDDVTGLKAQPESYKAFATATFDDVNASIIPEYFITGLPLKSSPPTEEQGWEASSSYNTTWSASNVRLGGKLDASNQYLSFKDIYIPAATIMTVEYSITIHPATLGTTFKIFAGEETVYSVTQKGGAADISDHDYSGIIENYVLKNPVTLLQCYNSYSSIDLIDTSFLEIHGTSTKIISVKFSYGE